MADDTPPTFRAHAEDRDGTIVVVAEGDLDLMGAPRLIEALPSEGAAPVVIDLGGVGFMDSSGLRSLLEARRACAEAGRGFALARPSDPVLRVLELVDLIAEFDVAPS